MSNIQLGGKKYHTLHKDACQKLTDVPTTSGYVLAHFMQVPMIGTDRSETVFRLRLYEDVALRIRGVVESYLGLFVPSRSF